MGIMAAMHTGSLGITTPAGFAAAGGTCGIKPSGAPDLTLIVADRVCTAAGVFTTNRLPGAPVIVSREHVGRGRARAIVCNSGVSNVGTGARGLRDARAMCDAVARAVGCERHEVLVCSTGIIGHRLPMDRILPGIAALAGQLQRGPDVDAAAARCIMTTDLVPKSAGRSLRLSGRTVTIAGIAKGSGMIAPNMATMLAFITTDAAIAPATLRKAVKAAAGETFNRISVDHDTSTSDSLLVLASGAAGNARLGRSGRDYDAFAAALTDVCGDLAYQIVKDGEGATRVFRVVVRGARHVADADRVGRTIVGSPLVKTAVHGGDPNWGRLIMAVGRSGAACSFETLILTIGGVAVYRRGAPVALDDARLKQLQAAMRADEVRFTVDLGQGKAAATWLGCDLSKEYVSINADYTT